MIRILALIILIPFLFKTASAEESCIDKYKNWSRVEKPVLRDYIPRENYEAASDPHVFIDQKGHLKMIYSGDDADSDDDSGDDSGYISIKIASGKDWETWSPTSVLLGASKNITHPRSKETPFYRLTKNGQHQIYFIGYDDEETYESEIYLAISDTLEGPYTVFKKPVIARGVLDGKQVRTITSPSVIEHDNRLYMTFLAWDDFPEPRHVWVMGAISDDSGATWTDIKEVPVPVGMEGQITRSPNGKYIALRTGEHKDSEAIFLSCAYHPFGPYEQSDRPILTKASTHWEKDENQAPQITFDPVSGQAYVYYVGADHSKGWWIMMAYNKD